jgi:hypothetical protein
VSECKPLLAGFIGVLKKPQNEAKAGGVIVNKHSTDVVSLLSLLRIIYSVRLYECAP